MIFIPYLEHLSEARVNNVLLLSFFLTLTQVFLILKLSELAKCCMKSLSCVFYEIYFKYIHACWAPSCFFEEPEISWVAAVRKHCPGQAPSVLEFSVCPEPKHGLTSALMPCSHSHTFAASLLYFLWKGPDLGLCGEYLTSKPPDITRNLLKRLCWWMKAGTL